MIEGIVVVPLVLTQILSIPESPLTHIAGDVDPLHVFGLDVTFDGSLLAFFSTNLTHINMFYQSNRIFTFVSLHHRLDGPVQFFLVARKLDRT